MSWFWRGFQSAVFYYLSCAPCMTCAHQRKRAKANRRARAIKAAQKQEQGIYVHPSPFDTNVYWHEEMLLGPGPPQRKGNKDKGKADGAKRLDTGGHGSSGGGSSADTTLGIQSFESIREEEEEYEDDDWNRKRYQRADEMLWGEDDASLASFLHPGPFVGKGPIVNSDGTYYGIRNPAVNDLHPPIVSTQPTDPSSARWMLQPPPTAKVMEGKERANRSRSTSRASYTKGSRGTGGAAAGAHIPHKISGEGKSIAGLNQTESIPAGREASCLPARSKNHQATAFTSNSNAATSILSKRKRPPPIILADTTNKEPVHASSNVVQSSLRPASPGSVGRGPSAAQKLKSAHAEPDLEPRVDISASTSSSLHASQSQKSIGLSEKMQSNTPPYEASVRLPLATEAEESFLALPEMGSRFPGQDSFRFPPTEAWQTSTVEHDQPSQRWSMDL